MKKNILIAILSIACICSLSWNYTQAAKAMPAPIIIETDDINVGADMINQTRFGNMAGTFEVIPNDPTQASASTTIILTYNAEE
jgi:hypothetical protein